MPEIVPVELTLPSGTWVTLYQRGWDAADDDSLAFLGGDDSIWAFPTPEELAAYVVAHDDHHLAGSPLWADVRRWSRRDFEPAPEDRFDLRVPGTAAAQDMLAEVLVFLRVELPAEDWRAEPLADLVATGMSVYGVPLGPPDPRPAGGLTVWELAVEEADGRVGPPPGVAPDAAGDAATAMAGQRLEQVAPGVEALWLGAEGEGAHTLMARDDESGWSFLGEPGAVVTAHTAEGLAAFLAAGEDPALDAAPWSALRGRDDLDLEPYEDNVVDLDRLGALLAPNLDRAGAAALLDVRVLVQELATWLDLEEAVRAFDEDQPLGRFFVRDLLDLVSGSVHGPGRLAGVDFDRVREEWQAVVEDLTSRMEWVD